MLPFFYYINCTEYAVLNYRHARLFKGLFKNFFKNMKLLIKIGRAFEDFKETFREKFL